VLYCPPCHSIVPHHCHIHFDIFHYFLNPPPHSPHFVSVSCHPPESYDVTFYLIAVVHLLCDARHPCSQPLFWEFNYKNDEHFAFLSHLSLWPVPGGTRQALLIATNIGLNSVALQVLGTPSVMWTLGGCHLLALQGWSYPIWVVFLQLLCLTSLISSVRINIASDDYYFHYLLVSPPSSTTP